VPITLLRFMARWCWWHSIDWGSKAIRLFSILRDDRKVLLITLVLLLFIDLRDGLQLDVSMVNRFS